MRCARPLRPSRASKGSGARTGTWSRSSSPTPACRWRTSRTKPCGGTCTERLRAAVRDIVRRQACDKLTRLYRDLFEVEITVSAGLARELLLVDEVGAAPTSVRAKEGEPCLHVPEWAPLWPEGRVPTRFLCRHTLVLGETGSGKTMSGIRPLLTALTAPDLPDGTVGCVLAVDPKKELWDTVADRGARLIDVGARGRTVVNLMAGEQWYVTGDIEAERYLEAAERNPDRAPRR